MTMRPTGLNLSDIPDNRGKGFICGNEKYFIVKNCTGVYAYKNACPHIGVPLEWVEDQFLDSSRTMIQCANHGAMFVIENGLCVSGPCSGKRLMAVATAVINDEIFLL